MKPKTETENRNTKTGQTENREDRFKTDFSLLKIRFLVDNGSILH